MVTSIALLYFEKETLGLSPAEAAGIAFWLGLPWSMKMVVGVASDVRPILGSRRGAYLILGALCTLAGYAALATTVRTKSVYLAAALLVTIGYMVQDVVADALSVEIARNDEEIGQIQTLGRIATLTGGIAVGLPSGWLAALVGPRGVFTCAVMVAALVIFIFRATPDVGQGYSYWAIDRLGFDERFLGLLAQVSSVLGLVGLLVFRQTIVRRPVSFTLFWVIVAGTILYLPNIGLFYGLHEWLGISARSLALIDTTISAPLNQLAMVPMLVLIAKTAPPGGEATMFAIMASLMNLALSASQLFTQYLNEAFAVTQHDYSNLGRLMVSVGAIGLVPLLALPLLWRQERTAPSSAVVSTAEPAAFPPRRGAGQPTARRRA